MRFNVNILNNVNLDETPLPASSYNELPHITDMKHAASKHARAHAQLLGLIASHGLAQEFSIHLIHKHFDIPEGRVMVYEAVRGPNHPDFVLCSPRDPAKVENLRGLYFRALPEGKMAAYEYTTEPGEDMGKHTDFVAQFAQTALALGVQDVFALTAKKFHSGVLTEFEISDVISTVLVSNPTWLPSADPKASTSTDWIATPDYAACANAADDRIPGIISLKCLETRSQGHYNVTCSSTRSGTHYEQKPAMSGSELLLDGQPLPQDSEAFAVISRARAIVEAA
ncbi:hypothetical protein BDY21DRAFT_198526 [Lineolata rhizophorae]|uniref:Uncharacterized protein n=1 Tax=Lineolata rhizophorae TaxID=578093 RepID=A0A6A6P524_9PEZI|nr:hypothetical protein BDY21DRAFT_198526 [Lineolata rhizophorae]